MTIAYVGVGTNIDQVTHSKVAIDELSRLDPNLKVSTIYQCKPVGFEGNNFYNFVVELDTSLELTEFSHCLRKIEIKWGRKKNTQKYQDRTLDLDIILFGEEISSSNPEVPRSDIYKYPFVALPLYELAPELVIPGDGQTIKEIWTQMDGHESLTIVDSLL